MVDTRRSDGDPRPRSRRSRARYLRPMQMLIHLTPPDRDAWRKDFDGDYEDRMNAGLTQLQLWNDADGTGVTALFEVNDRAKAQGWLDRESATGPAIDARFLRTA